MLSRLCLNPSGAGRRRSQDSSLVARAPERFSEFSDRARLTAELEPFEPLDGFALVGNDLRLPDQSNGHEAHGDNAKDENEANVGLVSRKAENAAKPKHGKGSPSTRFDLLAVVRTNPSRQRGRMALAK